MRAVQQRYLALVVRFLRGHEEHVQASLVSRELLGYFLRSLDDPQVEVLSLYDEVVAIADLLLNLLDFVAGEAGHDAVYQRSIDAAAFLEPLLEALAELPQFDVLLDAVLQYVTVQEYELAGEDNQALGGITVEGLVAAIEQLHELARIAAGRSIFELARRVEGDTGLCGVGDDEANLGLVSQGHEGSVLRIGVQGAADDVDALQGVHGLAILTSLQVDVVQAVLTVEPLGHTSFNRLDDDYRTVEVGLLVHVPDNPIYERAKEVTLSELNHLLGHYALRCKLLV